MADGVFALATVGLSLANLVLAGPVGPFEAPQDLRSSLNAAEVAGYATYRDGSPGGDFGEPGSGIAISLNALPKGFTEGLVAAEDQRFRSHTGVDPIAMVRSGLAWLRGGDIAGASTISQQTVKNALADPVDRRNRTIMAKAREAILAYRLEATLSKDEILEAYVNTVYFGRGVHGAGRAAQTWFGRPWDGIGLGEQAFLAGVINAPSRLDPVKRPERARLRRDYVIQRLLSEGVISDEEADAARSSELAVLPAAEGTPHQSGSWVALAARSAVRRNRQAADVLRRIGPGAEVRTTIDPNIQDVAQQVLRDGLGRIARSVAAGHLEGFDGDVGAEEWSAARQALPGPSDTWRRAIVLAAGDKVEVVLEQGERAILTNGDDYDPGDILAAAANENGEVSPVLFPDIQGAVVVMDVGSGDILAYVGGHDASMTRFDRVRALRQPGSAVKPFLYLAALEQGMAYDQLVLDLPVAIPTGDDVWRPQNYGGGAGAGAVPLFSALEESSNLVAARLGYEIGVDRFAEMAEAAGAYALDAPVQQVPSAVLGTSATTVVDMAAGFASIAAGGIAVMPSLLMEVRNSDGDVVWTPDIPRSRAFASYRSIEDLQKMLTGVTRRGTARQAFKEAELVVAGKTGTSQDNRDAWFIGFTPEIVVAVWVGRDNGASIGSARTGGNTAAPIAADLFGRLARSGLTRAEYSGWPLDLLVDRAGGSGERMRSAGEPMRLNGSVLGSAERYEEQRERTDNLGTWRSNNDLMERRSGSGRDRGLRFRSPW